MLRAVVLTQYRRVTDRRKDGQMDGIAIASTALAMRALWHAAKKLKFLKTDRHPFNGLFSRTIWVSLED